MKYVIKGIFYIHASAPPQYLDDMCSVIGQELLKMAGPCNSVILTLILILKFKKHYFWFLLIEWIDTSQDSAAIIIVHEFGAATCLIWGCGASGVEPWQTGTSTILFRPHRGGQGEWRAAGGAQNARESACCRLHGPLRKCSAVWANQTNNQHQINNEELKKIFWLINNNKIHIYFYLFWIQINNLSKKSQVYFKLFYFLLNLTYNIMLRENSDE